MFGNVGGTDGDKMRNKIRDDRIELNLTLLFRIQFLSNSRKQEEYSFPFLFFSNIRDNYRAKARNRTIHPCFRRILVGHGMIRDETRDSRERLEVRAMLLEFGTDLPPSRNRPCPCRYATLHPPRIIVLARPDRTGRAATESIDRANL